MSRSVRRSASLRVDGRIFLTLARITKRIDRIITPERLRIYPIVFLTASLLGVGISTLVRIMNPTVQGPFIPDYLAHWTGGGLLLSGDRRHLYDPVTQHGFQSDAIGADVPLSWFVSLPAVAGFYAPLAVLPYTISGVLWLLLSTALLVCCVISLKSLAPRLMLRNRTTAIMAVLASPIVFELLGGGQDSAFILAVWLLGIQLLKDHRNAWAGAVLGLGCAKPQLVVLVPLVLLATKNYRALLTFVAVGAAILGLSIGLVGMEGLGQWLAALSSPLYMEMVQHGQAWKMVSLPSFVQAFFPDGWGDWITPMLTFLALPAGAGILLHRLYKLRKQRVDPQGIWIAALATTAVFSPHLVTYDAILFVPVVFYLLERRPSPYVRVASVAAFFLLWLVPVLYVAAAKLPWPLSVIDAPWSALPFAVIWFASLRALQYPNIRVLDKAEFPTRPPNDMA